LKDGIGASLLLKMVAGKGRIRIKMKQRDQNTSKQLSNRQVIGQQGINLIEEIVLGMGLVWRPTGVHDTGIDGEIEVRLPETGAVTNRIVKVQSKATAGRFTAETNTHFEYVCQLKDVDYWIGGNVPVILIVSRPKDREAYWIHVNEYFKDPKRRKDLRVFFDKSKHKLSKDSYRNLVQLAVPEDSGIYFPPPPKEEILYTNLLEVNYYPPDIYLAETDLRKAEDFWDRAKENELEMPNEWVLRENSILSFHDLRERPWDIFCERGTVETFDTEEWALSEDLDKKRVFVELLNKCLDKRLRKHGCSYNKQYGCYFIWATQNLQKTEFSYRSHTQKTTREIFAPYESKTTKGRIAYCRHSAFIGHFLRIENKWYLEINPTYVFTSDGHNQSRYAAERLSNIKLLERNDAVCGQVIMWSRFLTQRGTLFKADYKMLEFSKLLQIMTNCSINDKAWLERCDSDAEEVSEDDHDVGLFNSCNLHTVRFSHLLCGEKPIGNRFN